MDSQNPSSSSKRSRQFSNESGSQTPNFDSQTPVTPPFNMNQWAGFTPSHLQNVQWSGSTPFGMEQQPTQHPIMTPTNLFNYPHGTIFENRPIGSQVSFIPQQPPFIPQQPPFIPQSQQHSSGAESSTQSMPPHVEQTQPRIDVNAPLMPEPTDVWLSAEDMLPIQNRSKASKAWPHFFLSFDKKKAKCRYCDIIYTASSKSGTGHLLRHTPKCTALPNLGQRTLDEFISRPNAPEPYNYNYEECSAELSRMIIQTEKPFALAEHRAFNKYVKKNQPEHRETSRRTVRSKAMLQYVNLKQELIAEFAKTSSRFSITADGWDSGCDYSYICITAHWLDNDWNLQKRIIEFAKLEYPHNATNMHNIIMNGINEFGLRSKILCVTFDNATSMTAVANMLKSNLERVFLNGDLLHVRCGCHVLNLCIKDGLQGLRQYHDKFKHVVLHLNSTKWRRQEWRNFCKENSIRYRKFPLENNTRWNSMQIMLSSCIEYKEPLTTFWNRAFPDNPLLDEDWNNMEMYVDFLCAFMDATNSFSHVYKPTSPYFIGNVIPIAQLFHKYREVDTYLGFLPAMESKWLKYWTDIPYVYVFSIILDPRWKFEGAMSLVTIYKQLMGVSFDVDSYRDEIRSAFFSVFNSYESVLGNITRPSSRSTTGAGSSGGGFRGATLNALKGLVSQLQPERPSTAASDLAEYHMYINYDYMRAYNEEEANTLDLLSWWRHQNKSLPVMSAMAKDFFSVQVSSVASERAFSAAKRVLDEKRTSMNSDTLRMCVCYKDWMDAAERKQGEVEDDSDNDSDETSTESNA